MTVATETYAYDCPAALPCVALMENPAAAAIWREMEPLASDSDEDPARRSEFYSVVQRTPLLTVPAESLPLDLRDSGYTVVVKHEGAQTGRAYKARGNTNALQQGDRNELPVVASTGNHANTAAVSARMLGYVGVIVECPQDTAKPKKQAMVRNGADLHDRHTSLPDALDAAEATGKLDGYRFIHPYDHLPVVAGQGTITLEVAEQLEALGLANARKTLLYPGGGGGHVAGNAVAAAVVAPDAEVRVGQMYGAHGIAAALEGWTFDANTLDKSCDGAAVPVPGELPMQIIADQQFVAGVDVVSKGAVGEAMAVLARVHEVPEPAGALAMAAALQYMRANPRNNQDPMPHVVMAVTSGVMTSPQKVTEFMQAARAEGYLSGKEALQTVSQSHLETVNDELAAVSEAGSVLQDRGFNVLSGAVEMRVYSDKPVRPADYEDAAVDPEAIDEYYAQLEELGIVLAAASRQHG